jgi:hypothetical protein
MLLLRLYGCFLSVIDYIGLHGSEFLGSRPVIAPIAQNGVQNCPNEHDLPSEVGDYPLRARNKTAANLILGGEVA